jgi:hypothetical protein
MVLDRWESGGSFPGLGIRGITGLHGYYLAGSVLVALRDAAGATNTKEWRRIATSVVISWDGDNLSAMASSAGQAIFNSKLMPSEML